MGNPYYAESAPSGDPDEVYRHHKITALRLMGELRHRRWEGDQQTPALLALTHATLAQTAMTRALAIKRNGNNGT